MGVLDAALHAGRETTYGTPVTPTRSFEAQADAHKRVVSYLEAPGMRAGMQALRADRRRQVLDGASGTITVAPLSKGLGMLLRATFGSSAIAQEGATTAWTQTHSTAAAGPLGESLTVQIVRPPLSGATQTFTYHGGKVTDWEFMQKVGENLSLALTMDYEDESTAEAAASAAYPVDPLTPYSWVECVVTVAGSAVDVRDFSVKGASALATDRRYLRGASLKREPIRNAVPNYTGVLTADFTDTTAYARFVAGTVVAVSATWTSTTTAGTGFPFKLGITLPAVQFTGDTPEVSLSSLPTQPMPFQVLHDGTNPAVTVTYTSTDTAY